MLEIHPDISALAMRQRDRLVPLYRQFYQAPKAARPLVHIHVPLEAQDAPTWEERLGDPAAMLKAVLLQSQSHLLLEDDHLPILRVEFGTGQVAFAFGCGVFMPTNSLPCCAGPVLDDAAAIGSLAEPSLHAGWYEKLEVFTAYFRGHMPDGYVIQIPDIQSPFNNAHLIRGNDILLDFYDQPRDVEHVLSVVSDYTSKLIPHLRSMFEHEPGWFYDAGALWKGAARLSNCSMHMIGNALYQAHVRPFDQQILRSCGGGRIHYCGTAADVIDAMLGMDHLTGLDLDVTIHDLWSICEKMPEDMPFLAASCRGETLERLYRGDWPQKRNIIIQVYCKDIEEGREVLAKLRASMPA